MRRILFGAIISVLLCIPAFAQQQQPQQQQTANDPSGPDQQVFVPPPAKQPAAAQQPATAQNSDSTKPIQSQPGATSNAPGKAAPVGSSDRLFFALPNFGTVENRENIKPLTTKQKFDLQRRSTFDPVEFPYVGLLAGISQATNGDPGYGQGALGYAKRYGASFLDSVDENFMVGAIYPSLLREDPPLLSNGEGWLFSSHGLFHQPNFCDAHGFRKKYV
jgi:hypothetical protein